MSTVAFYDASCGKCGKRFGWQGSLSDKPSCPKCGTYEQPPQSDIDQIETLQRLMKVGYSATNADLAEMQKLSGLSFGQLGKILRIPKSVIDNVMNNASTLRDDLRRKWVDVCGFGPK